MYRSITVLIQFFHAQQVGYKLEYIGWLQTPQVMRRGKEYMEYEYITVPSSATYD